MALPFAFTGNLTPTGEQLDADLTALGNLTPNPCSVSGVNTLTLTPLSNVPIPVYQPYTQFTGIAAGTNTTAVTAQVGTLPALPVYKDTQSSGAVQLTGSEIVANTKLWLMYDPALNSGAGGFHLIAPPSVNTRNPQTITSITLAALLPQTGTVSQILLGNTSIGDVVDIGFPALVSIGLVWQGYVPAPGTVTLNVFNMTTGTITPNFGSYRVAARGFT